MLAFIAAWNEYLFALTFTSIDPSARTVPVAIAYISGAVARQEPFGEIMVAATLGKLGLAAKDIIVEDRRAVVTQETKRSNLVLACAMENQLAFRGTVAVQSEKTKDDAMVSMRSAVCKGEQVVLQKFVAYYTSRDFPLDSLPQLALQKVAEAKEKGFQAFCEEQKAYLKRYW